MNNDLRKHIIAIVALLLLMSAPSFAARRDTLLLRRIFTYASKIDTVKMQKKSYVYIRCNANVKRRNALLLAVPTMFAVAHSGRREYLSETYGSVDINGYPRIQYNKLATVSTFPHLREVGPELIEYLMRLTLRPAFCRADGLTVCCVCIYQPAVPCFYQLLHTVLQ